jgi:dTDP-4-amino-4,6-dideoxygalactose transaminase
MRPVRRIGSNNNASAKRWISVWPPVAPSVIFRRPGRELPFPLADSRFRLFSKARHGLWLALQAHELKVGDEVLVPEYHHGSEVEALIRAGLRPRFYRVDERLEPDLEHLTSLLTPRVRVLYLIHYLGFPQDTTRWRRWSDEHRLHLVEDAAQAWLSERNGTPTGSVGDIAIFCLYKTLGLSDGGAVVSSRPLPRPAKPALLGLNNLWISAERWVRQRADVTRALGRYSYVPFDPNSDSLALGDPNASPSRTAIFVISRQADLAVASRRRANYRTLLQELPALVAPPFSELPDGASPLQFPIEVTDKQGTLERLANAGVEGADMWPRPHPVTQGRESDHMRALRSRLVGLPVHHGLGESELAHIVQGVRSAVGRVS